MKRAPLSYAIAVALLLAGGARPAFAAEGHAGLKKDGTPAFTVDSAGVPTFSGLVSCDTIDTDGSGVLSCGTDATGGGSGTVVASTASTVCDQRTTTAVIPFDNTIPQISQGTEWVTMSYTPVSSSNRLRITVFATFTNSSSIPVAIPVFVGSGSNAEFVVGGIGTFNRIHNGAVMKEIDSYSGAKTISSRFGPSSGTAFLNDATNDYGARQCSTLLIEEIEP